MQSHGEADDPEVMLLNFHHTTPVHLRSLKPWVHDLMIVKKRKARLESIRDAERQYWQSMLPKIEVHQLNSHAKGVSSMKLSANHRYLAVGTTHGDILVYNITGAFWQGVAGIVNSEKSNDAVIDITWSLDCSEIITLNKMGLMAFWSVQAGDSMQNADRKTLNFKRLAHGIQPRRLLALIEMDKDESDFVFQSGPLSKLGIQRGSFGAVKTAFHSAMSILGIQHEAYVGLENGDIVLCKLALRWDDQTAAAYPSSVSLTTLNTNITTVGRGKNKLGQGIEADLLRQHKTAILQLVLVEQTGHLASVDVRGNICLWSYSRSALTDYGWFQPYKRYRLEMSKIMYSPVDNTRPNIIFSDRQKDGIQVTRQQIAADRQKAEGFIESLSLGDAWHEENLWEQKRVTRIYPPPNREVSEAGGVFHVVIRQMQSNLLATYFTRVYAPHKVRCKRLLQTCKMPDSSRVLFLLLFQEHPPQKAHLTAVVLNLVNMQMEDMRLDIGLPQTVYEECLQQDIVSCSVSGSHSVTGSYYLCINLAGRLSLYSLTTGTQLFRLNDGRHIPNDDFQGCEMKLSDLRYPQRARVLVANKGSSFTIILYTAPAEKDKHNPTHITALNLVDNHTIEEKKEHEEMFKKWRVSAQSHGLKCERLSPKRPVMVDLALLVLECMDAALVQANIPLPRNPEDVKRRRALDIEYLYRALADQNGHLKAGVERPRTAVPDDTATVADRTIASPQ